MQLKHPFQHSEFKGIIPHEVRLGKLVEHYAFYEFKQAGEIELLHKNIQVIENKVTLGELDCLIKHNNQLIHLEVVYKFYLYDETVGTEELDHWIGPNRNDHLVKKLTKLQSKQLPLLHHPTTQKHLQELGLNSEDFLQRVDFRAQLFIPLNKSITSSNLNQQCISGFYIRLNELDNFTNNQFYIPTKLDWLIEPHEKVKWIEINTFKQELNDLLNAKKSPLCWLKTTEGMLQKFFVVWWDQ